MLAACAGTSLALASTAAADPVDIDQSASAVIGELTDQGYNVQLNWVSGVSSVPLSQCRVLGVHNPDDSPGPPTTFTTVYVDVSCPNHDGDVGIELEGGLGFG